MKKIECLKVYSGQFIEFCAKDYNSGKVGEADAVSLDIIRGISGKYIPIENKPSKKDYGFVWMGCEEKQDWDSEQFRKDTDDWFAMKEVLESQHKVCYEKSGKYIILRSGRTYRLARLRYKVTSRQGHPVTLDELISVQQTSLSNHTDLLDGCKRVDTNCVGFLEVGSDKYTYFVHENHFHLCNNQSFRICRLEDLAA